MKSIPLAIGSEIILANGGLEDYIRSVDHGQKIMLISDSGVPRQYIDRVRGICPNVSLVILPAGEGSKTFDLLLQILSAMLQAHFTREDCVLALGGGVVCDIAGFAAATYMRGIGLYLIPSTLLAQIDASIGGKTAIDFEGCKNSVGAFYPAESILIDAGLLRSLDERQMRAGLAEAIKMAATCDAGLFALLEGGDDSNACLEEIILRSVLIKKEIVDADPKENGIRRLLNFGHTVGHALESVCRGSMLHGECVAVGMLPMCGDDVRYRMEALLMKYHLPTRLGRSSDELIPYLLSDKKGTADGIQTVLVDRVGSYRFATLTVEEIRERMEKWQ